jgi:hypothetical protein
MQDLIVELQQAIRKDGRSLYAIAKAADLRYSVVHRFARGERVGISLVSAAKLLQALGYELRQTGKAR